jgi:hypothetical protein
VWSRNCWWGTPPIVKDPPYWKYLTSSSITWKARVRRIYIYNVNTSSWSTPLFHILKVFNTFPCRSRWELCCGRLHYSEEEPMHISFTLIHLEVERKQEIWCAWSANHPSSHKGGALCACPRLFTRALRVHTWNMFGCKVLRRVSTYGKLSWSRAVKRITSLNHAHINRLVSVVCSLTITEASARAELARK